MKIKSKTILLIVALACFLVIFILDVSNFGNDFYNFSGRIDILQILKIILIIIAAALFFGLFLFRKRKYFQRLGFTIPIAMIIFSLADFTDLVIFNYGLNQEYNSFAAKRDIKNGKVQILETGLVLPLGNNWERQQEIEQQIEKQFGFEVNEVGCTVFPGMAKYNSVVEKYLDKRNGKNWKIRMKQRIDSALNEIK